MPPLELVRWMTRSVLMRMSAPSIAPTPVTSSMTPTLIGVPVGGAAAAAGAVGAAAEDVAALGDAAAAGALLGEAAADGELAAAGETAADGEAAAAGLGAAVVGAAAGGLVAAAGGAAAGVEQAVTTMATLPASETSSWARERVTPSIRFCTPQSLRAPLPVRRSSPRRLSPATRLLRHGVS